MATTRDLDFTGYGRPIVSFNATVTNPNRQSARAISVGTGDATIAARTNIGSLQWRINNGQLTISRSSASTGGLSAIRDTLLADVHCFIVTDAGQYVWETKGSGWSATQAFYTNSSNSGNVNALGMTRNAAIAFAMAMPASSATYATPQELEAALIAGDTIDAAAAQNYLDTLHDVNAGLAAQDPNYIHYVMYLYLSNWVRDSQP